LVSYEKIGIHPLPPALQILWLLLFDLPYLELPVMMFVVLQSVGLSKLCIKLDPELAMLWKQTV
jgi:hypothetical protein